MTVTAPTKRSTFGVVTYPRPRWRGERIALDPDEFYVGRDASNAIKIESAKVSRKHARIFRKSGTYWLRDPGSVNGVLVDGQTR